MPTLQKFAAFKLEIRYRDHLPPHVHVLAANRREVLIEIENLAVIGNIPSHELRGVLDWMREHRTLLLETWMRYHP